MSESSYPERMEAQQQEAWAGPLADVSEGVTAMPDHPVGADIDHIINCRLALQSAWAHLDRLEEQLTARQTMVARAWVEDEARARLTNKVVEVGSKLGGWS